MKAAELRLGNLFIEENSNKIIEVIGLEKNRVVFSGMFLDKWQAKPMPLTGDWLVKFGFKFNGFVKILGDKVCKTYKIKDFDLQIIDCGYYYKAKLECAEILNFKYVHQLQNLFFVLTGKEINYKQTI